MKVGNTVIYLSPLEREVYHKVVLEAKTLGVVGEETGRSTVTVERHLRNICRKTKSHGMMELIVWHYTRENVKVGG